MRYCLQLHYPVCLLCCLHMLSFSQCEYFSTHYCTIVYMTSFTFNLLCLHAVLFTITLHSILIVFCIYILSLHNDNVLTITITLHYNNDYSERPCLHTVLTVYNYTIQYTDLLFTYVILFTMDIFSQLLHNWHYTNVYSISSTYTYSTIYNYTTRYTNFAVYICCPFHNVIFFHNYCTIDSTTLSIAYP